MNKHQYRLVFNRSRGQLMAVAEVVASRGKHAGDSSAPSAGSYVVATLRALGFALALAFGGVATTAQAQIVADPGAPRTQQPTVLNSANGVPLVNIQTPSAAGVSRNTYKQFDVNSQGAILNNSRTNVQTELGGWVQANPWLATGSARVILNEVNSSNPSLLRGYIEVAGERAQIVIANPAGISCDGCGFINANRATLTTGVAIINGGNLEGYRVSGGVIDISGAGLDASRTDYTDLIARAVQINAGIWAKELKVTAGANQVDAEHTSITPIAGSGAAPAFGIDVAHLGGMYAGKIYLVATEPGVGVRNAGQIGASAGEVIVTVDGRLENSGLMQTQTDLRIDAAAGVTNSGTLSAARELALHTPADIDNSSGTLNALRLDIAADALANRGGVIEQTGAQALALQAGALSNRDGGRIGLPEPGTNSGNPSSGGAAGSEGGSDTADTGGAQQSTDNSGDTPTPPAFTPLADGMLAIAKLLNNDGGRITSGGALALDTRNGLDNAGGQLNLSSLSVTGAALDNSGGQISVIGAAQIRTAEVVNDAGKLELADTLIFETQRFSNRDGELQHAGGGAVALQVAGALDNSGGLIASNAAQLTIQSGSLINEGGQIEHAGADGLTLHTGALAGRGGEIASAGALTLTATDIDHRDATLNAAQITLTAESLDNRGGEIVALGGDASAIRIRNTLDNGDGGLIAANGALTLTSGALSNNAGTLLIQGAAQLQTGELSNNAGSIASAAKLRIDSATLYNTGGGSVQAGQDLTLNIAGLLDNDAGLIAANGALALTSGALSNNAGALVTQGAAQLQTGELSNNAGVIAAAKLRIDSATLHNNNGGAVQAGQDLTLNTSGLLDNDAGLITANGALALTSGALSNNAGALIAQGAVQLQTGALSNNAGVIASAANLRIDSATLTNNGGAVQAGQDLTLNSAGLLDNTAGLIAANGALNITAQTLLNRDTLTAATGSALGLQGETVTLNANGIDNHAGLIAAGSRIEAASATLDNSAGLLSSGGAITANVGALDNAGGVLRSGADQTLAAQTLTGAGQVLAQGNLTLTLQQDFENTGEITANGRAEVTVAGALTNRATLQAGDLSVHAASIDNTLDGEISGIRTHVVADGALTNRGLIDGSLTRIDAETIENIGTGRLYGDQLSLGAVTLINREETVGGVTQAGTIAARERLDIGAQTVINQEGALIFSAGGGEDAMNFGGALDADGHAIGSAGYIHNASATIESLGGLTFSTERLLNSNEHFSTERVLVVGPEQRSYVQPEGDPNKYDASSFRQDSWSHTFLLRWKNDPPPNDSGVLGASTIPRVGEQTCTGEEGAPDEVCTRLPGADYLPDNPAWAYFGLPAPAPEPAAPNQADFTLPADYQVALDAWQTEHDAWSAETDARYAALDAAIVTYNAPFTARDIRNWTQFSVTHTEYEDQVATSDPGLIRSGGSMTLLGGEFINDKSQILIGGVLQGDIDHLTNLDAQGQHVVHEEGTYVYTNSSWHGGWKNYYTRDWTPNLPYNPADVITTISLGVAVTQEHTQQGASGYAPDARSTGAVSGDAPGVRGISAVSGPTLGLTEVTLAAPADGAAPLAIRTAGVDTSIPSASLFHLAPGAGDYLIETDPRFAGYREWLGSDYMLTALGYDPALTQKRLGDGFYEQKLVRDQVAQLTGRRFLDGYANDEEEYAALMNAGVTFAQAYNLIPGVALSAAQMAQLTSDIVWLVEQDVTLPDGSTTRALVPQLYVRVQPGDLDGTGTLISANAVDLNLKGDFINSGTLAGRTAVLLSTENIENLGHIQGGAVALAARNDIDNLGGTISADTYLALSAGRDINVVSTTHSGANQAGASDFSRTNLDRIAGLYVTNPGGALIASAGRDVNLTAAQVINAGENSQTVISAGRDLNLNTVGVGVQENLVRDANNTLKQGGTQEVGTSIQTVGDITLSAGQDINARAAEVSSAQGALTAIAQRDVNLTAGEATSNWSEAHQRQSGGLLGSKQTTTRNSLEQTQAEATTFSGDTVTIGAGHDVN
ncbi:MAG: filamentous hemagglutinin N-terminal domain-containing protein, partial [Betaproteobacteria bacterium]|nr:filamentous hemagglutinin N-terminal domain-containing protein [Betaproteobacteria bacterium]